MRYLFIWFFVCLVFVTNLFANETILNCKRIGGLNFPYEFRVLEKNKLVLEYLPKTKRTIQWPIKIYENNYIESEKKLELGDNKMVLRIYLDRKEVQVDYLPNGGTHNFKCK